MPSSPLRNTQLNPSNKPGHIVSVALAHPPGCLAGTGGPKGKSHRQIPPLQASIVEPVNCIRKFDRDFSPATL